MKKVLVLNGGSSSFKLALYEVDNKSCLETPSKPLWKGSLEWGKDEKQIGTDAELAKGLKQLIQEVLANHKQIDAVGHRVVHGGSVFIKPVKINAQVKKDIAKLGPLAPLHNPIDLKGMEIVEGLLPKIPQYAVFDTAFHATLSEAASTYAGPYQWKEWGIKRYGFHGISYEYCAARCAYLLKRDLKSLKIVCCHLGNGCSVAAIEGGKSVDTTMGFTPLDGLMMGTRSGEVDPGILLYLQKNKKQSVEDLFEVLYHDSGLKGISGKSSDMREIMRLCEAGDKRTLLAYEMFVLSLKRHVGGMIAVLGGIDALIFTGGIGENVPQVRTAVCESLECCGVQIDEKVNATCRSDGVISMKGAKVKTMVIATEEDWSVALKCL